MLALQGQLWAHPVIRQEQVSFDQGKNGVARRNEVADFTVDFKIAGKWSNTDLASAYYRAASTAALAVLKYHRERGLAERAAGLGAHLRIRLNALAADHPEECRELRGAGLMLGLELSRNGEPLPRETDAILEDLKDAGYLAGKTGIGRNVLTFMPPLVVEEPDIEGLCDSLGRVLAARLGGAGGGA